MGSQHFSSCPWNILPVYCWTTQMEFSNTCCEHCFRVATDTPKKSPAWHAAPSHQARDDSMTVIPCSWRCRMRGGHCGHRTPRRSRGDRRRIWCGHHPGRANTIQPCAGLPANSNSIITITSPNNHAFGLLAHTHVYIDIDTHIYSDVQAEVSCRVGVHTPS